MTEQVTIVAAFKAAGLLDLFHWVGATAYTRVAQEYDEDAGHDQSVVGFLGYKYCLNLFDRATSSGKYSLPEGAPASHGRDLLRLGITDDAYKAMPNLEPSFVNRRDFRGSPAWAWGKYRWALQSFPFGEIDQIVWGQKSPTKQDIAHQPLTDDEAVLFDYADFDLDEPVVRLDDFVGTTLILAHAYNRETSVFEVYLGHSRANDGWGSGPWHWRQLVATSGAPDGGGVPLPESPNFPGSAPSTDVADAEVRFKDVGDQRGDIADSGA